MLILAGATIVVTAGVAALEASHQNTADTLSGAPPAVLSLGEQVQATIAVGLPWLLGLIAVPMGIVGIYGLVRIAGPRAPSGGRR